MGLETRETSYSIFKHNLIRDNSTIYESSKKLNDMLKSIYFLRKEKFIQWLHSKKLTKNYIENILRVLDNTLELEFKTPIELRDKLAKVKNRKYRTLALRNLFNFFEEYELIDNDLILKLKAKIKITEKSNIDSFIPSSLQIKDFLEKVNNYDPISLIFLKILLESGLRVTEV